MSIRDRVIRFERVAAASLVPNPKNWRRHPKRQRDALRGMLERVGFAGAELVRVLDDGRYMLIDGHLRADLMGEGDVPVLVTDLSESEADALLATFDPIGAMAEADDEALELLLSEVGEAFEGIEDLLAEVGDMWGIEAEADDSHVEEVPASPADEALARWGVQVGDVYLVRGGDGRVHRVMCGDSTSAEDVARLMDGARADCVVTDPPYGIRRDSGFGSAEGFNGVGKRIARRVYGDDWDSVRPAGETFDLLMGQARECIIWGGNFFADLLPSSTHWLVWDKVQTMPTFGDCELAYTTIKRTSVKKYTLQYNGLIGKEAERHHPTQKPVKLFVEVIGDYSEAGGLIADFFLGSGTALVACEQVGRICYGMELEPKYVSVALDRAVALGCEVERNPTP